VSISDRDLTEMILLLWGILLLLLLILAIGAERAR